MFTKKAIAAGALALALVGAGAASANAASTPPATSGSVGPVYIVNGADGAPVAAGTTLKFDQPIVGSPSKDDAYNDQNTFKAPSDATQVFTFVSPRGQESNKSQWKIFTTNDFYNGTKGVWLPDITPSAQLSQGTTNVAGLKASGGELSLGIAFAKNNVIIAGASYFTFINMDAGTGAYQYAYPADATTPPPTTTPTGPCADTADYKANAKNAGCFDVSISAPVVASTDGPLSLVAPTSTSVTLGSATVVNNLSTSTGHLGSFKVVDQRVTTRPGWTLNTTVQNFVKSDDSTKVIDKKQFGSQPLLEGTDATGITLGDKQTAGQASYPVKFAEAATGQGVGTTQLAADLTFVAPANSAVGTYTSKMTFTLVSK